jgi:hypothetical protein
VNLVRKNPAEVNVGSRGWPFRCCKIPRLLPLYTIELTLVNKCKILAKIPCEPCASSTMHLKMRLTLFKRPFFWNPFRMPRTDPSAWLNREILQKFNSRGSPSFIKVDQVWKWYLKLREKSLILNKFPSFCPLLIFILNNYTLNGFS